MNCMYESLPVEWRRRKRKALPKFTKRVLGQDKHRCALCGNWERLEAHHIIPICCGGKRHALRNGITLCYECHLPFHKNRNRDWGVDIGYSILQLTLLRQKHPRRFRWGAALADLIEIQATENRRRGSSSSSRTVHHSLVDRQSVRRAASSNEMEAVA